MEITILVLLISILLQFAAAFLALRLIWITGRYKAWVFITAAFFLQAIRRCIPLYHSLSGDLSHPADLTNELIGLALSLLMLIGVVLIAPLFRSIKDSERMLQKAYNEMEIRVKERTAELQTLNKELEAFSYSVSHDLRTPLRAIDGFSKILLEDYSGILDKQGLHYLQRVRAGTQNMGQLIDDLLNLSRIGRKPINKELIDLVTIARATYESLEDECRGRKVNFTTCECPPAFADPHLMQIVFMNLLSNALKFTRNRATTEIKMGCEVRNKQTVFFIKDNGVGFDMKYADKLFAPFQRLHHSEEYEGTGIGLATVQRIIHRHGGEIWVVSKPDLGTMFCFTLQGGKLWD